MAEEIHFRGFFRKVGHFRNFDGPVTLTLTSDEHESHIVENGLSTSANAILACGYIEFDCGRTYVRKTDGRTDGRTFFH